MTSSASSISAIRRLRDYPRQRLVTDVRAGIRVCVVMIPSVIAEAELSGLSPVHGLYVAPAGMIR